MPPKLTAPRAPPPPRPPPGMNGQLPRLVPPPPPPRQPRPRQPQPKPPPPPAAAAPPQAPPPPPPPPPPPQLLVPSPIHNEPSDPAIGTPPPVMKQAWPGGLPVSTPKLPKKSQSQPSLNSAKKIPPATTPNVPHKPPMAPTPAPLVPAATPKAPRKPAVKPAAPPQYVSQPQAECTQSTTKSQEMHLDDEAQQPGGQNPERVGLTVDYGPLETQSYYHGLLPRGEVEALLKGNGDFLVRKSEVKDKANKTVETLVISVKHKNEAKHVLVKYRMGGWTVGDKDKLMFDTVVDLVKWFKAKELPLTVNAPAVLKRPIERQPWQLDHQQILLETRLGEGAFGEVWMARLVSDRGTVMAAVKTMKSKRDLTKEMIKTFIDEAKRMREYSHQNIVQFYGIATQKQPVMIVMEFCEGGTLLAYVKNPQLSTDELCRLCTEAAAGLAYLEKKGCVHRDIAARNCLLTGTYTVKISDFGLSINAKDAAAGGAGNNPLPVRWLAPECVLKKEFSIKSDVWAFGVLLWEVFSNGKDPYPTMKNPEVLRSVIREGYRMEKPSGATPKKAFDYMKSCWDEDPLKRPTFKSLEKNLKALTNQLKKAN